MHKPTGAPCASETMNATQIEALYHRAVQSAMDAPEFLPPHLENDLCNEAMQYWQGQILAHFRGILADAVDEATEDAIEPFGKAWALLETLKIVKERIKDVADDAALRDEMAIYHSLIAISRTLVNPALAHAQ